MTPISDQLVADVRDQFEDMVVHGYNESYLNATARAIIRIVREAAPTPPVTGSADGAIQPKPQDGRRLENRVAALEEAITNTNRLYGLLKGQLDGVDEDHTELAGQVQEQQKWLDELTDRVTKLDTPPGPCPECGNDGWNEPCTCARDLFDELTAPPQPAADDAEMRGDPPLTRKRIHDLYKPDVDAGYISYRIDPADPEQVRVVADALAFNDRDWGVMYAKRILTALANLNGADQ